MNAPIESTPFDERTAEGLTRMRAIYGVDAPVEVIVTHEFDQTVNEIQGTTDYRRERAMGMTLAKVFTLEDGTYRIVVWAGIFEDEFDRERALITLEHEALHVAVSLRGESLNTVRIQRGIPANSARGHFVALAGIAIEEGRVERALAERHSVRAADQEAVFARAVPSFYESLRLASIEYQDTLDVSALAEHVIGAFESLLNYSAYMAATAVSDDILERYAYADPVCLKVLGDPWVTALRAVTEVPSATTAVSRVDLDHAVDVTAAAVERWMEHVGFGCEDTDEDGFYFHVHNAEDWVCEPAVGELYSDQP